VLLAALARSSYRLKERPFTVSEAKSAKEAFVTSASALLMPVIEIDGSQIAEGKPGPITMELRRIFYDHAEMSSRHRLLQQSDAET
jgi:D-alanine transaminase